MKTFSGSRNIAFLVQGLFEISDSIGFDCVYQYRQIRDALEKQDEGYSVQLFAERSVASRYPDVKIEPLEAFYKWSTRHDDGLIIYHYCGEWKEIDDHLMRRSAPSVVRWHNNTPPWFYMRGSISNALHTLSGFDNIVELIEAPHLYFWVNSEFTRQQFLSLGGRVDKSAVVFPASRYLYKSFQDEGRKSKRGFCHDGYDLLFVGRVVNHKGYAGIVAVADRLKRMTNLEVRVHLPGRIDSAMKSELSEFAEELGVDARLYGEVSEDELAALYSNSDVFLCLSEHEGFGLPVFEAMACQIPIITWATTAFSDLLAGHPFAFPEYDLNMFTAAILSLSDPKIREKVLEQQKQILDRYDAAVVEEQLRNALMKSQDDHLSANLIASFPESLSANCSFAKEIANFAQSSRQHPISVVKHDSGNNLYSLYDLSIYRRFIDMQYLERRQLLQPALADLSVTFDAHEFSTVDGKSHEDGIHVAFDANSRHHMVFGPYIQFPKGDFTVEFLVVPETEQNVSAMADVATEGRTIANKLLKIKRNTDDNHVLDFTVAEEGTIVEFRLSPREDRNGSISFRGVNVRRRR